MSDFVRPYGLYSPWNSPGKNTGVGSCSLLLAIFPTQGSKQISCTAGGFLISWAIREAVRCELYLKKLWFKRKAAREKRKINYKGTTILTASFSAAVTGAIGQWTIFKVLKKKVLSIRGCRIPYLWKSLRKLKPSSDRQWNWEGLSISGFQWSNCEEKKKEESCEIQEGMLTKEIGNMSKSMQAVTVWNSNY